MIIKIEKLSKKYKLNKNFSIKDINTQICNGVYGLIGENGSGKSTFLKTIATILPIQSGNISVDGEDVSENILEFRKKIGYLPQDFEFFESLTCYEMLEYISTLKQNKVIEEEIDNLLRDFNLLDKKYCEIKTLSGGMKQRLAILQTILGGSKIIILDEPTNGLDPIERLRFRNIITSLSKDRIIIISSHIISDIAILCENIGIMKKGELVYTGSVDNLIEKMQNKIYIKEIKQYEKIEEYNNLISILRKKNSYEIRVYSKNENTGFIKAEPTLEDAYFYIMNLGGQLE